MAAIEMKNIVKKYGDGFPAVNDVSIDVADGEFMILVGPSGCGKSTLLRMIVGLEDITSGDMVIGGDRVNDLAPRDRNLSMVFQNYALYPHLTVYENIAFPLRLAKMKDSEVDEKVRAASKTLDLDEHLERKPANLSGGQRQRLAIARALATNPRILIFDEATSALDYESERLIQENMRHIVKSRTVIVIAHRLAAVRNCDRIIAVQDGRIVEDGTHKDLIALPTSLYGRMWRIQSEGNAA